LEYTATKASAIHEFVIERPLICVLKVDFPTLRRKPSHMRVLTPPYRGFACLLSLASLALSAGCGSDSSSPQGSGGTVASSSGGVTGGATTGGSSVTTGGSTTGGAATGGSAAGASATGGSLTSTGGSSTGGGGGTLATGGAGVTGGKSSTGGAGGNTSAGSVSTGGSAAAGANGGGGSGGKAGTGGAATAGSTSEGGATSGTFTVTSPGWMNMAGCAANMSSSCANEITRSGAGTSPELHWTGAPAGAKSFAVVLQDLSGGSTHWVIWNIPATTTMLPANVDRTTAMPAMPAGAQQCGKGTDAATKYGYIGPGAPCNVYEFMVYALSAATFSPTSTTDPAAVRTQLNALDASALLGTAALRGRTNMTCN
jgi:Raf kinase inhibitor-like YbhB/YbcL family protein